MLKATRRVFSGVEKGASVFLGEDQAKSFSPYPDYPVEIEQLFYTEDSPQTLLTRDDTHRAYDINPSPGAMQLLRMRIPTQKEAIAALQKAKKPIPTDWQKFYLHSTTSADYIYILSGNVTYHIGDKAIDLGPGDFLAQVGPEHYWMNEHEEGCVILCLMMGIQSGSKEQGGFSKD